MLNCSGKPIAFVFQVWALPAVLGTEVPELALRGFPWCCQSVSDLNLEMPSLFRTYSEGAFTQMTQPKKQKKKTLHDSELLGRFEQSKFCVIVFAKGFPSVKLAGSNSCER